MFVGCGPRLLAGALAFALGCAEEMQPDPGPIDVGETNSASLAAKKKRHELVMGISMPAGWHSRRRAADVLAQLDRFAGPPRSGGVGQYPGTFSIWTDFSAGPSPEAPRATFPDRELLDGLHERHITPVIFMQPIGPELIKKQNPDINLARRYSNQAIANGSFDPFLEDWAVQARDYGRPIIVRFAQEMNADWFPWGNYKYRKFHRVGNDATNFKHAWRHVYRVVKRIAPNVKFFWCPWAAPKTLAAWFPGKDYVDYIGFDAYNFDNPNATMMDIYRRTLKALRRLNIPRDARGFSKIPIIIGETGVRVGMSGRAKWIEQGYRAVRRNHPDVAAIIYFDINVPNENNNWRLKVGSPAMHAYANLASRPAFQGRFAPYRGPISAERKRELSQ